MSIATKWCIGTVEKSISSVSFGAHKLVLFSQPWMGAARLTGWDLRPTILVAHKWGAVLKLRHRAFRIRFETWGQTFWGREMTAWVPTLLSSDPPPEAPGSQVHNFSPRAVIPLRIGWTSRFMNKLWGYYSKTQKIFSGHGFARLAVGGLWAPRSPQPFFSMIFQDFFSSRFWMLGFNSSSER